MKKHLYTIKKSCPTTKHDIELTDDIKQHIIINRIYHIPKESKTVNYNNNNNKLVYNMIIGVSPTERLDRYLNYQNEKVLDFDNYLCDKYEPITDKLERDQYKYGCQLKKDDFLKVVDDVTDAKSDFRSMNVIFDNRTGKIAIYRIPKWEYHLLDSGICEIIRTIKSNYLDIYEQYLIKKLANSYSNLVELNARLEEYYRFIICFELPPYVKYKTNEEILDRNNYDESNEYSLETHYMSIYRDQKKSLLKSEINKTRRDVTNIIKQNTKSNLEFLNHEILKIIKADDGEFKLIMSENAMHK